MPVKYIHNELYLQLRSRLEKLLKRHFLITVMF